MLTGHEYGVGRKPADKLGDIKIALFAIPKLKGAEAAGAPGAPVGHQHRRQHYGKAAQLHSTTDRGDDRALQHQHQWQGGQ